MHSCRDFGEIIQDGEALLLADLGEIELARQGVHHRGVRIVNDAVDMRDGHAVPFQHLQDASLVFERPGRIILPALLADIELLQFSVATNIHPPAAPPARLRFAALDGAADVLLDPGDDLAVLFRITGAGLCRSTHGKSFRLSWLRRASVTRSNGRRP